MASRHGVHRVTWDVPVIMTAFPTTPQDALRVRALQLLHILAALMY
jgi:hypothetical protein